MTHSGDNNFSAPQKDSTNYVPRVAYTLGQIQPVRSTYIAHDPYFFMDVDDITLEEELMAEFERDYSTAHFSADSISDESLLNILLSFDNNSACLTEENFVPVSLGEIKKQLSKSRYAAALLEFAYVNRIGIHSFAGLEGIEYRRDENVILYQPALSKIELMKGIVKALRQAWQNYQGALLHPISLYPDHAVFVNRAQKADIAATLVRVGWELELAGVSDLWQDLSQGSLRDLTHSFGREAALDFRSLNNGRAALSTFESWFLSDRSRASDAALIKKMLSDYSGHQFENEDMSQLVLIDLIKALGEMPYGKNYLAQSIPVLLTDPIFTEVRERSAANFLWFIKFEKTFAELEQGLQKENMLSTATFASKEQHSVSLNPDHKGDSFDARTNSETGILVPFPKPHHRSGNNSSVKARRGKSADVVPFDISVRPFNGNYFT
jgi:hypothetical protein